MVKWPVSTRQARQAEADITAMYYVYVLKSTQHRKSYVGYTDNTQRRLQEHNAGKSIFSRKYRPWKIIYIEKFITESEAIKREKYFKTHAGRKKLSSLF